MDTYPIPERLTCELIRERLRRARYRSTYAAELPDSASAPAHRAAVLLPLYWLDDGWHLIFIRRAEHAHDRHSGEVGFPGGRWQPTDPDCMTTAMREAEEEIGLARDTVSLLGQLTPFLTVSQFLVTPVVGCIAWPQPLRPDPHEVSRIFSIPVAWLRNPKHHRSRIYPAPDHPQARPVVFFDNYDGECLWGITARITLDFLSCVCNAHSD